MMHRVQAVDAKIMSKHTNPRSPGTHLVGSWVIDSISVYRDPRTGTQYVGNWASRETLWISGKRCAVPRSDQASCSSSAAFGQVPARPRSRALNTANPLCTASAGNFSDPSSSTKLSGNLRC